MKHIFLKVLSLRDKKSNRRECVRLYTLLHFLACLTKLNFSVRCSKCWQNTDPQQCTILGKELCRFKVEQLMGMYSLMAV